MATKKAKPRCRTIGGQSFDLTPRATPCTLGRGKRTLSTADVRTLSMRRDRSEYLTRARFARLVEHGAEQADSWSRAHAEKPLVSDVYRVIAPELGGMSLDAFKSRLLAERFPLERIDLPELLTAEQRRKAAIGQQGAFAIRRGKRMT